MPKAPQFLSLDDVRQYGIEAQNHATRTRQNRRRLMAWLFERAAKEYLEQHPTEQEEPCPPTPRNDR